jgi:HPr kinase/phosphorylase
MPAASDAEPKTVHASCVAIDGRGVLIVGPSGCGKSSLALRLIAFGAVLVADDGVTVTRASDGLIARAPEAIGGLIEARGVGILQIAQAGPVPLEIVVDLSQPEAARLPPAHRYSLLGLSLPCLHNADSPHFPAAILLYMRGNRKEPA